MKLSRKAAAAVLAAALTLPLSGVLTYGKPQALTFTDVCAMAAAGFAIPWAFSGLYGLRMLEGGYLLVLTPLVAAFCSDSLALFTGMALGRHKLAPLVSPHKTVEGAAGGLVGGMAGMAIFCLVYRAITGVNLGLPLCVALGLLGALLGELGDLARDMTILKAAPDGAAALLTGIYDTKTPKSLSGSQPMRRFLYLTETIQACCAGLGDSFQPRTDAELCLLRLWDESLSGDLTALSQRIDRLEDRVANGIPVKTVPQTAGTSPKTAPLSRDSAGTSRDVPSDDRPPMPEEPPLPEEPGGRDRVYDIPDEEPPAARPAIKPARKPPVAKSAAVVGDTGKWDAMKEHCKGRLAVNHRVFLNMVQGAVDGDCLTLYCQNEFVRDSLNNNTVLHVLQEVASAAEGQTIRVALTVGGAPTGKKPAKPRPKPEKVTEKAPEKPTEKAPEPEQTPPWEEPPAEKVPDKLDEVAAQGRQLENFKIK